MAHRIHSRQEKLKLYKKLTITIAAVIIFCLAAVIVFRAIDRQKLRKQEAYEAEQGVVRINGKKYLPKKNIETYLFMGIDSLDKVKKAEDYGESGQSDVLMLMVRDISEGTFKTLAINRNTLTNVKSLDLEASCENTVDAVSELLGGQKIDGYAAVNMGAISIINHMAGGVTVTIEDDFSKVDPSLKIGDTVQLSDEQAVHYVHDRWDVADETNENRMKRQSVYMEGLKKNIKEKCQTDSTYPLDLYNALGDYMVTNISANKFSKLALLVVKEKDEGEVSISGTEGLDELDFATFEADEESLNAAIAELFYKEYTE